jgi:hypothetical protein
MIRSPWAREYARAPRTYIWGTEASLLARATAGTDFPLSRTIRTACALNSFVNARRLRLAMTHSYRTFVRSGVSTKPGQVQIHLA